MKTDILFKAINKWIDDISCNDFHFIPGVLLSCAQYGRIFQLRANQQIIEDYFQLSPDVFNIVKEYNPIRLIKFLERVVSLRMLCSANKSFDLTLKSQRRSA
jgi:hypothetical protein